MRSAVSSCCARDVTSETLHAPAKTAIVTSPHFVPNMGYPLRAMDLRISIPVWLPAVGGQLSTQRVPWDFGQQFIADLGPLRFPTEQSQKGRGGEGRVSGGTVVRGFWVCWWMACQMLIFGRTKPISYFFTCISKKRRSQFRVVAKLAHGGYFGMRISFHARIVCGHRPLDG